MYANRLGVDALRTIMLGLALALVALAVPAQSQVVVQYTATLTTGFGDGPTIGVGDVNFDTANNGQPACNALNPGPPFSGALGSATEAVASFNGIASVTNTAMAPRAVIFPKADNANGLITTCLTTQTLIPTFLTKRVQSSVLVWPGTTGTFAAGGGFAGSTGSPFQKVPTFNPFQIVKATTIPSTAPPKPSPKFGGSIRVNGSSNVALGIVGGAGSIWTGTLPVRLSVGAQGGTATPTFQPTPVPANFHRTADSAVVPGQAKQVFFPWTTGRVVASDRTGNFWTLRTRSGFDNRNAAGTTGTLQLVTPALTDITGLAPLPFAITSVLRLTFTPEPGATLLLGAGVATLFGLYVVRRRQG